MQRRTLHQRRTSSADLPFAAGGNRNQASLRIRLTSSNTAVDPPLLSLFPVIDFVETDFESIGTIHWTGFILSLDLSIMTGLSCIGFRRCDHQLGLWPDPIRYMQDRSFGARRSTTRQVMHIEDKTRTRYDMQDGAGLIPMVPQSGWNT